MFRRFTILCVLFMSMILNPQLVVAEEMGQTSLEGHAGEARAEHVEKSSSLIRIGYVTGFGLVRNASGKERGYLSDLVRILERRSSRHFVLVPLSNNTPHSFLESGEIDIFALALKTPEREKTLVFGENDASVTQVVLVADKHKDLFHDDVEYMNGKTVAVLPSVGLEHSLQVWLQEQNITMDVVLPSTVEAFFASDADFHLTTTHYLPPDTQVVTVLQAKGLYFMSAPSGAQKLRLLQSSLDHTLERDPNLLQRLNTTYIVPRIKGSPILTRQQTQILETASKSRANNVLTAFSANSPPLQYLNDKGEADGITIDILRLLNDKYSLTSYLMPIDITVTNDVTNFDVLTTIVGNRREKDQHFLETDPYLSVPMEFVLRKNLPKEKLHSVGMLDYSSLDHDYVRSFFPQWQLSTFASFNSMFAAYTKGRISGMILSSLDADYVISIAGKEENMRMHTPLILPHTLYISKKLHPESIHIANAFIATLDPITVNTIVLNTVDSFRPQITVSTVFERYWLYALAFVVLASVAWLGLHMRRERLHKSTLLRMLSVDSLTGIASARKFTEVVMQTLATAKSDQYIIGSLDIDNFSIINRNYGYERGNALLKNLATTLQSVLGSVMILARQKDDIFLVLLKNNSNNTLLNDDSCRHILDTEAKHILGDKFTLSMSFGCYVIEDPKLPLHKMMDYCTIARQVGKSTFGFVTTFFTKQMHEQVRMQSFVLGQMKAGIDNREFFLVYQPKVELNTLRITGAEALVRWSTEDGHIISPQHFIPIFEKNGFIAQFDHYVFEMVCQYISVHKKSVHIPPIAVNLSGHTLMHGETAKRLHETMAEYGISSTEIDIEITESAIVNECGLFIAKVNELKEMGFKIALDDFGTGVSCLNRLRSIPLDVVKLDKAFLDANISELKGYTIVDNIISMLQQLNIKVVAEGVETVLHTDWLTHIGCDVAQGFYFSKPLRGDRFFELLKTPPNFDQLSAPSFVPTKEERITHGEEPFMAASA